MSQQKPENIRLFIDCQTSCDINYIKTRVNYVNYVNNRFIADVYLLITSQTTGSGGRKYTLQITGQGQFERISDTLSYTNLPTATDAERRIKAADMVQKAILPYVLKTKKAESLNVIVEQSDSVENQAGTEDIDPWNLWVMSISLNGSFNSENNYSSNNLGGGLSADRVSANLKTAFEFDLNRESNRYGSGADEFKFTNSNFEFDNITVWSLNPHLSAGGSVSIEQSTYSNYKLSAFLTPTLEYNYYPYSQYQTQAITLKYRVGPRYFRYYEETIFSKLQETRYEESLSLRIRYNKPWGEIRGSSSFSHYFYDFKKNRLSFYSDVELRILKGLFLNLGGSYSFKRDQLNIAKGDVSDQDLLTRRRELNSNFEFDFNFGIRYRFGSIFNNIVNPRF